MLHWDNVRSSSRKRHRQQVLARKARRVPIGIALVLALLSAATLWHVMSEVQNLTASDNLPAILVGDREDIHYDVAKLAPGQTRFFAYPSDLPRLIVQKDAKGIVRVAFASCTQCYAYRGAHQLRGGELICARCQHAMRLGDPGEKMTRDKGCVAVPVPFSVEREKLLVKRQIVAEQAEALRQSAPKYR